MGSPVPVWGLGAGVGGGLGGLGLALGWAPWRGVDKRGPMVYNTAAMVGQYLQRCRRWARLAVRVAKVWLALAASVSFCLFILEEAAQLTVFATWQAPREHRQPHAAVFRTITDITRIVLYAGGWLNPLAYVSYRMWLEASELWYWSAYVLHMGGDQR